MKPNSDPDPEPPAMAILTPSFEPDYQQFLELRTSVERHIPNLEHRVVVPEADVPLFGALGGIDVTSERALIPGRYRKLPIRGWWVNLSVPWLPVRGWILQQALKLGAVARMDHDLVVVVDSDVAFIRTINEYRFAKQSIPLFRRNEGVHSGMQRHVKWHEVAARLLGLSRKVSLPATDYVSSLNVWSPELVRQMLSRIEAQTGLPWFDAVTRELDFSEFTAYGLFVDYCLSDQTKVVDLERWCCEYWDARQLTGLEAKKLLDSIRPEHVAIMISAKSRTSHDTRLEVLHDAEAIAARQDSV